MAVLFVLTEHASFLSPERLAEYERIRARLERIAGKPVATAPYAELRVPGGTDALVLSGSSAPWAAHDQRELERLGDLVRSFEGPVLGICAGMQLQALFAGGRVARSRREDPPGFRSIEVLDDRDLLRGVPASATVYTRHTDEVIGLPEAFRVLAGSEQCAIEAIAAADRPWWGTQFHPEEFDEEHPAGERVLRSFFELAGVG
ncbi:MAG: gamma-glutamyl-gamma-aminobutyrate hydrolase family protein [Actinobacteria bacterium]|nr:gamma-glutamyl-gamma-aminobutyrate hydrolase family protein [Actinomycetota bacterium]